MATRLLLKKIKTTLKIPILGVFDSDPHGLKVHECDCLQADSTLDPLSLYEQFKEHVI